MNREKSNAHDGLLSDRVEKRFSFHTPVVPHERLELKNPGTDMENATDALTATYWG